MIDLQDDASIATHILRLGANTDRMLHPELSISSKLKQLDGMSIYDALNDIYRLTVNF